MRWRGLVWSVLLLAALPAAPADAARSRLADQGATNGYQAQFDIAGDDVIYTRQAADRWLEQRSARPGAADRLLRRLAQVPPLPDDPEQGASFLQVGFRASPQHLATLVVTGTSMKGNPYYDSIRLDAGPLAGPWQEMDLCVSGLDIGRYTLDGSRIAYSTACAYQQDSHVSVRDLDSGQTLRDVNTGNGSVVQIELAGRYLAYLHYDYPRAGPYGEIVVRNLDSGEVVYAVPGTNGSFSLQNDGKIARLSTLGPNGEVVPETGCHTIDWFSPADPATPHRVPGCTAAEPRIAGDRIAFVASDGVAKAAAVADLSGNVRRIASPVDRVDYDGRRLVSRTVSCAGALTLWEEDLGAAPLAEDPACPIRISRAKLRDGRFTPRIACPAGCRGVLYLEVAGRKGSIVGSGNGQFAIQPGTARHVRAVPYGRWRLFGSKARRRRVTLRADSVDRNGAAATFRRTVSVARR